MAVKHDTRAKAFSVLAVLTILTATASFGDDKEKSASLEAQMREAQAHFEITNDYVHSWTKFPDLSGQNVITLSNVTYRPRNGRATVVVFTSSWCIPCQRLAPQLKAMQDKHRELFTDFVFVYTGDTAKDAAGYVTEYKLSGTNILGTMASIQEFRNPEPPTVFVGDRHGWLTKMIVKPDSAALESLDSFLTKISLN